MFQLNAQEQAKADAIIVKSVNALKSIYSIEYEVVQEKNHELRPNINATFICSKDENVEDVAFGKAMVIAKGNIEQNGKIEKFAFSYDGDQFKYHKGNHFKKELNKPAKNFVITYLMPFVYSLNVLPYTRNGYASPSTKYEYLGKEQYNGEQCYKIKANIFRKGEKKIAFTQYWYIQCDNYLPVGLTNKTFTQKINITALNKEYKKTVFNINP
ncbi:hypothetical protein [uncultured Psychroserpens sp.]|uniref:hypothetical protein n=1 Tax=uncultured Psychroserpens sp. TaxID=255436 RepID=UPI00261708B4|nr:hypothetical protein [uncultured Psychroserpens sp.]